MVVEAFAQGPCIYPVRLVGEDMEKEDDDMLISILASLCRVGLLLSFGEESAVLLSIEAVAA
jgi:hypothetical protein